LIDREQNVVSHSGSSQATQMRSPLVGEYYATSHG
jgi:hypothetical protein